MNKYYIKLCLCIFGGPLGLHYWYTKKYGKAIIFLLTTGGLGIWYIFDIVRLILDKNYLSDNLENMKEHSNEKNKVETKEIISKEHLNEEVNELDDILNNRFLKSTEL